MYKCYRFTYLEISAHNVFSDAHSFWNFAQNIPVSLSCYVQNFETIKQMMWIWGNPLVGIIWPLGCLIFKRKVIHWQNAILLRWNAWRSYGIHLKTPSWQFSNSYDSQFNGILSQQTSFVWEYDRFRKDLKLWDLYLELSDHNGIRLISIRDCKSGRHI